MSNDLDFNDAPRPRTYGRKPRSAFRTAFGLSSGCLLGIAAAGLLVCGGLAIGLTALVGIGASVSTSRSTAR